MPLNTSHPENITGFAEWMIWTNNVTDSIFGIGIVFVVFVIGILQLNERIGFKESTIVMGFSCAILSIFIRIFGLMSDFYMWTIIIILALAVIFMLWTSR